MKPNSNLDELLSCFMDGELSPRQRTEVQRMAARDPQVARRLRQLESTQTLLCSLPPAEAPGDMLEHIRHSLERRTLLQEQPVARKRSAGVWHLVFRRFVAAAAMIALLGGLGVVVYQIVAPVSNTGTLPIAGRVEPLPAGPEPVLLMPLRVADEGFSGRLEFRTASLTQADAFVTRAIENSGLADRAQLEPEADQRVYRLVGDRESVHRLVASLNGVWSDFDAATLEIAGPEGSTEPIVVEAVTAEQMARIVARRNTAATIETAHAYAVMNDMMQNMPGGELLSYIQEDPGSIIVAAPRPKLTGPNDPATGTATPPSQDMAEVSLTIVLLRTK